MATATPTYQGTQLDLAQDGALIRHGNPGAEQISNGADDSRWYEVPPVLRR